eukprot:NODE_17838_length_923_cov_7.574121.p1 GENE.NODE_17838_length_923_cov_7.574121~~NODE_17838_length_923_cov_7.574121.p1  ORF type:complete len:242 (-),score=37.48 NODE_17838_length_923_cov_7.574121:110-835(-)
MDIRNRHAVAPTESNAPPKDSNGGAVACVTPIPQFEPLDCFMIKQDVEHFEAITGIETENSYQVLGAAGARAAFGPVLAKESSNFFARMACGNRRPWTIRLGEPPHVIRIERPFRFLLPEVHVRHAPTGALLGTVTRSCRGFPFQRNFTIRDAAGDIALLISCPFFSFGWNFTVHDFDGNELGKIEKRWAGLCQEFFTDADNFGVHFPVELPSAYKALLLGAVLLIDFCFFENNEGSRRRR